MQKNDVQSQKVNGDGDNIYWGWGGMGTKYFTVSFTTVVTVVSGGKIGRRTARSGDVDDDDAATASAQHLSSRRVTKNAVK